MSNYDMVNYYIKKIREVLEKVDVAFVNHLYEEDSAAEAIQLRTILVGIDKVRSCADEIERYTSKMDAGER